LVSVPEARRATVYEPGIDVIPIGKSFLFPAAPTLCSMRLMPLMPIATPVIGRSIVGVVVMIFSLFVVERRIKQK
jgi:hypothetical protein